MNTHHDKPTNMPWPPLIYIAAVALAVIANWLWPLPWLSNPLSDFLFAFGWLLVVLALAMIVSAIRTMRRAHTTVKPHEAAEHLVTRGPFSFTRNPIYLGNTIIMLGIGLIAGVVWFIVFAPIAAFATQKLAIEPEERHLQARFGKKYRDYAKKIRRWV